MVFNKVVLNHNKPDAIIQNYTLATMDIDQQPNAKNPTCPDNAVQFVVGSYEYSTPFQGDPYLNSDSIDMVTNLAKRDGYTVKVLKDADASVENYENYLSCSQ